MISPFCSQETLKFNSNIPNWKFNEEMKKWLFLDNDGGVHILNEIDLST
jgi:hypothetical protein